MKAGLGIVVGISIGLMGGASQADVTTEQLREVEAFMAGVRALDPHTMKSEPGFQALVEAHVPARGALGEFLEFMAAAGFECPWPANAPRRIDPEMPTYPCAFEPDLGPSGQPNWSSVIEGAWFVITAHYDNGGNVTKLKASMIHGYVGP